MAAMRAALKDAAAAVNRPLDVRFSIDQLERLNAAGDSPLKGRLDLGRLGMAGHSYGAWTTLAIAGEVFIGPRGREVSLPDPRVRAAVAMSAPSPRDKTTLDRAFAGITIACLHMTGTLDDSPVSDTTAAERREPFDHTPAVGDQLLVTFTGGDHMIFSGRPRAGLGADARDALFQGLIRQATTAFWDATLSGDAAARAWLSGGEFARVLGGDGVLEQKLSPGRQTVLGP
jgi:predicted dienelactone hydrolase